MDPIDWGLAQRVGELLAGTSPSMPPSATDVRPLVERFAQSVASYSSLTVDHPLPALELVDRPRWIEANIATMRPLLAPLGARLGEGSGPLAGVMRSASGLLLGAQVGAVTGMLSQRVLGQYDIALLDEAVAPRLLLVSPNLLQAARNMGADRDQLVAWVAIHEVTHAVQFGGTPWLRGHLAGLLRELIESLEVRPNVGRSLRMPDIEELRELGRRLRGGEVLRLTLGDERWALVERMQATMSLIEGHAEHVMDAVGAEELPSLDRMRAAMTRRRRERAWPWRIIERLLGMELKLRQYEVGRRFCDAVVAHGGPERLAEVWRSPEMLPTAAELERPALWMARTRAAA
jgi:coenzyme F420 biosynthesis associated uncharacterized protein